MASNPVTGGGAPQTQSILLLRCIGYGLLLLTIVDLLVILFPLNLMDPEWEFQTIGAIVERSPVPLIGIGLLFFGGEQLRKRGELAFLKLLSWSSLGLSIICCAVIPLVLLTSAERLTKQIDENFSRELTQQVAQINVVEEQLSQTTNEAIVRFLESQGRSLEGQTPDQVKSDLISGLAISKQEAQNQIRGEINKRQISLKKNAGKWAIAAEISALIFFLAWRLTRWTRVAFKGIWPKKRKTVYR